MLPVARFKRIDQRGESQPPHGPREHQSAQNQAASETHPALDAQRKTGFIRAFRGAQQIAAVHPRGGHGEQRQHQRHLPAGHDQILDASPANLARGDPANQQEDAQHDENDGRSQQWILV